MTERGISNNEGKKDNKICFKSYCVALFGSCLADPHRMAGADCIQRILGNRYGKLLPGELFA